MNMYPGYELHFEMTIRSFLGDKADHIASQVHSVKYRKEWYKKVLIKIQKQIIEFETTTRHKQQLTTWCDSAIQVLSERDLNEYKLLMYIMRLMGSILGYQGIRGSKLHSLVYWQTCEQHYTEEIFNGEDVMSDYYETLNVIESKKELIGGLKEKGYSDFKVSQILNISEYQVKKLRKQL